MSAPDSPPSVTSHFMEFARAAEIHAQQRHGLMLRPGDWSQLDLILDRERMQGDASEWESLILCYGAWIGQTLIEKCHAEWAGFDEPVPPRIRLQGMFYSPLDAVHRRLADPTAPTIQALVSRLMPAMTFPANDEREVNRLAWDRRVTDARYVNPQALTRLTPEQIQDSLDPWLTATSISGLNVLCLAAGGGTHGPLLAQAGARVTVADFSPALLEIDEQAARHLQLELETVVADMSDLAVFSDRCFDLIVQPVSVCYLPDVQPLYRHLSRILKPGGRYLSQQKSPVSLQAGVWDEAATSYLTPLPATEGSRLPSEPMTPLAQRESEMVEYLHTFDSLLGELCRHGFVIEDVQEPLRSDAWSPPGTAAHRAVYFPPYLKILARRRSPGAGTPGLP